MPKRSRLKRGTVKFFQPNLRRELITKMTPSEVEIAEERFKKPIRDFSLKDLQKEWTEIMATYPTTEWGDIKEALKKIK